MKKFTAIAIDDDKVFLTILQKLVNSIRFVELVETHTNPVSGALAVVNLEPDFLFLDVEMPYVDGFETIEMLKHRPKTIVISSHESSHESVQMIKPDAFISKPIHKEELEEILLRLSEE
ncbi:MAG: response regulator [Cyclobacteriaceae bacterium]